MKIKDLPNDSQPRIKFIKCGPEYLTDSELLAILLRTGTINENVVDMSSGLINEFGLDKLFSCSLKELQKIKGIGPTKAMQLLTISEISKRIKFAENPIINISKAKDVFKYFHEKLKDKQEEYFYILMLNTKNDIIGEHLVSKGILDASIIHPREIFRPAIKNSCARIILIHNHPSGDPTPSEEDLNINKKLRDVGREIDIRVIDSVIIGKDKFWSWSECP
ncbi:DNA repair protein RadC [Candidatus Pacearchaeota archaeon]|nr:DNA repair protein RadC [Candidatus Pacearchaeota archaeon]